MAYSVSEIRTPHARRYLQQLGKHWSHRFSVEMSDDRCDIDFGNGERCLLTASDDRLTVGVRCEAHALAELQQVVVEHLNRFAFREGALSFVWRDGARHSYPQDTAVSQ